MKLRPFAALLIVLGAVAVSSSALAAEVGKKHDAWALVARAIHSYEQNGPEKTFADINAGIEEYRIRDLSVFVLDKDGNVLADSGDASRVGGSPYWRECTPDQKLNEIAAMATDGFYLNYEKSPKDHPSDTGHLYLKRVGDYLFGSHYHQ